MQPGERKHKEQGTVGETGQTAGSDCFSCLRDTRVGRKQLSPALPGSSSQSNG